MLKRVRSLICLLITISIVATLVLYYFLQNYLVLLVLLLLFNLMVLRKFSKPLLGYVLFPFGADWIKIDYRWRMNLRMVADIKRSFKRALEVIQTKMLEDYCVHTMDFREYKSNLNAIKKVCDFVEMFAQVNRELIEDDKIKK